MLAKLMELIDSARNGGKAEAAAAAAAAAPQTVLTHCQ